MFACTSGDQGPTGIAGGNTATAVFQDGVSPVAAYTGCQDALLDSSEPNGNAGGCNYILSGIYSTTTQYNTAIKFDLSYIVPSNVQVTSAVLTLYTDSATDNSGSNTYTAYAITRLWTEGTGACGSATTGVNVSWNTYDGAGNLWTAPGGDFSATAASNALNVTAVAVGSALSFNLNTAVVQSWISSPSTNYGLMIKGSAASGTGWLRPCSREISNTAYRPKLTVNYIVP
jgi:hypothetical protein